MRNLNIENGYVTIQLSAAQCAILAKACRFASEETLSDDIDHWRTMAALFHACAIAGTLLLYSPSLRYLRAAKFGTFASMGWLIDRI
jgi:hypothetical protein